MELVLERTYLADGYTIGKLSVNGEPFCDTLEDKDRGLDNGDSLDRIMKVKVKGRTAIPTGRYQVMMNVQSPRFKNKAQYSFCNGYLPRLFGVKGYEGVLIHIGNTAEDTEGCILVGENKAAGRVLNSTRTFIRLHEILADAAAEGEEIFITVKK